MLKINSIPSKIVFFIAIFWVSEFYSQVGIGTTNPTAQLTVNEDATFNESGGAFAFKIKTEIIDYMFYVNGSLNRLGVNNNNPLYPIHFKAFGTTNWQMYFENSYTSAGASALFQNTNANNGNRVLAGATYYVGNSLEAPGVLGMSLNPINTGNNGRGGIGVLGLANNENGNAIEAALSFNGNYIGWAGYFNADLYCAGTFYGSDRRLKRDIEPISNALDAINELEPVSYYYDTDTYPQIGLDENRRSFGFIAQDLELIFPEMVKEKILVTNSNRKRDASVSDERKTDTFKVVNYTLLIPILTEAIKEQQQIIEGQNSQIQSLEERLANLERRLETIENN